MYQIIDGEIFSGGPVTTVAGIVFLGEYQDHATLVAAVPATGSGKWAYIIDSTWAAFPPKLSGMWYDNPATSTWERKGSYSDFFSDTRAVWYDDGDDTKRLQFQISGISAAATRTATWQDKDITVADEADLQLVEAKFTDMQEPNGFPDKTEVTLSFDDGTRTLTVTKVGASFDIYSDSTKYNFTANETKQIADTEGIHYIYWDDSGVIQETITFSSDIITKYAIVAMVYWDATNNKGYLFDERHGIQMDGATHKYLHLTRGAVIDQNGSALGNFSIDQDGSADAHAQFSVASGTHYDEDLVTTLNAIGSTTGLTVFYLDGSDWRWTTNAGFSVLTTGTGRLAYNNSGAQTEVSNNNFVLCHVFATNAYDQNCIAIQGQNDYANLPSAREGAATEINTLVLSGLPNPEFKAIGTVIFQTSDGYTNSVKGRTRTTDDGDNYVDHRASEGSASTGIDDSLYLKTDGSRELTANWDIGDGFRIDADKIQARDGDGLALYEDGGAGIFVEDGGQVGIGTNAPTEKIEVYNGTDNTSVLALINNQSTSGVKLAEVKMQNDTNNIGIGMNSTGTGLVRLNSVVMMEFASGSTKEVLSVTNTAATFNDPGNDLDFIFEGDSDTVLLTIDSNNDSIGVGIQGGTAAKMEILDTATAQLRLTQDAGVDYTDLTTNSDGYFDINSSGGIITFGSSLWTFKPGSNRWVYDQDSAIANEAGIMHIAANAGDLNSAIVFEDTNAATTARKLAIYSNIRKLIISAFDDDGTNEIEVMSFASWQGVVFNDNQDSAVDFCFKGDTDANLLCGDAGNNSVAVGASAGATYLFEVAGYTGITGGNLDIVASDASVRDLTITNSAGGWEFEIQTDGDLIVTSTTADKNIDFTDIGDTNFISAKAASTVFTIENTDAGTQNVTLRVENATSLFDIQKQSAGWVSIKQAGNQIIGFGVTVAQEAVRYLAGETVFNEDGNDINHIFEGTTDTELLHLDAGNDTVQVGKTAATSGRKFDVDGVAGAVGHVSDVQALSDGASIAFDMSSGYNATVTVAGDRAMAAPSNIPTGGGGVITITCDGTDRTITWNAAYRFAGGTQTTTLFEASSVNEVSWYSPDGTNVTIMGVKYNVG